MSLWSQIRGVERSPGAARAEVDPGRTGAAATSAGRDLRGAAHRLALGLLALCLGLGAPGPVAADEASPFPRPAALEPDVQFWTRIFTAVGTDGGLIHDSRHLEVVYEEVRFPEGASRRLRQRIVKRAKSRIRSALRELARGRRSGLDAETQRILSLWPEGVTNETLRRASRRLRFQLGQADKFRAGLVRSGKWEPHIRRTLTGMGLPVELAALPHVESSYTPHAWSRVGAAGLWQFTRSTGRRFMRVDHVVDERLDPYKSTVAAARLLEQNLQTTGTWPLAITAYNHGAAGMRRAVRQLGTSDIATIARKYRSRTFGFASRNFYVEFLAAVDVDFHAERYFGKLRLEPPIDYDVVEMPFFARAATLQRALGVDAGVLRDANPALRRPVWAGTKHIPRGFTVRVPRAHLAKPLAQAVADIPRSQRFARQTPDTTHVVRRGETLSVIASRYGVSQRDIVAMNGLRNRHRIRAGQRLRLPVEGAAQPAVARAEPPKDGRYTVRRGDTLSRIASRFGLEERELVQRNGLRNRHRIFAGQQLLVAFPAAEQAVGNAARAEEEPSAASPPAARSDAPEPAEGPGTVVAAARPGVGADEGPDADATDPGSEVPGLKADPSDYSVASDHTIEVQAAETLGHYAEWLDLRASQLRRINGRRYGQPLAIGRRLRLDFSRVTPETFEHRRLAYHRGLQEEFFGRFEIQGTRVHVLRRGDSLWSLSKDRYDLPLWLLRQYNPDVDFHALHAGTRVTVPLLRPHRSGDAGAPGASNGPETGEANAPSRPDAGGRALLAGRP